MANGGARKPSAAKQMLGSLIQKTGYSLTRLIPETKLAFQHIPGWFSVAEAEALYLLAATSGAARMLEVGHFLGRSTSAICEGIRDSQRTVEFNSYDLGFTNADEFRQHFKSIRATTLYSMPKEFEDLVYSQNKTTTELATRNLERFGLAKFVNLISGDFSRLDHTRYGFIFCDALHDAGEIATILPHVIAASEDDSVWAFHDMTDGNVAQVLSRCPARLIKVIDVLGVFRFRRFDGAS